MEDQGEWCLVVEGCWQQGVQVFLFDLWVGVVFWQVIDVVVGKDQDQLCFYVFYCFCVVFEFVLGQFGLVLVVVVDYVLLGDQIGGNFLFVEQWMLVVVVQLVLFVVQWLVDQFVYVIGKGVDS